MVGAEFEPGRELFGGRAPRRCTYVDLGEGAIGTKGTAPTGSGEGGKVAFWSTAELVSELRRANKEGTTRDALRRLGRCGLIVLDEWGYLPTDPDGARLLLRVVPMRYERIAPILTTNIELSRWGEIFADDDMAKAMTDRIVHHGRLVTYDRESYRVKHALMRGEL